MIIVIMKFELHLIENYEIDYFETSDSLNEAKICFYFDDEKKLRRNYVEKLYRCKFIKCFVENTFNINQWIVKISLYFKHYIKSIDRIILRSDSESKSYFYDLICTFKLIVDLRMINNKIKQFDVEQTKKFCSQFRHEFFISIEYNDFEYVSIDDV